MVSRGAGTVVHVAGAVSLAGYVLLASHAGDIEARPWLILASCLGWIALAVVAWSRRDTRSMWWAVVGWALLFRLVGVWTQPTWEDDYHRYLWDGYQTITTGDPYAAAPADWFGEGAGGEVPDAVIDALDQINFPHLPTVYGPVAQAGFAAAAWLGAGQLWILKLILIGFEMLGWLVLYRVVDRRVAVFLCWCPLAVTEIAFAGHVDALGVMALAVAAGGWARGRAGTVVVGTALAIGTKVFGVVLLPFLVSRFGWRWGVLAVALVALCYAPFWWQGSLMGGEAFGAMASGFEYNSTGYALLAWVVPEHGVRLVAFLLFLAGAAGLWWTWRQGDRAMAPPMAAVFGWLFWWSPVFNPWYALWLLPGWALRPSAWGVGVLLAVPLVYAHSWTESGGAVANYAHPWWTRPLEVGVVIVVVIASRWWPRRPAIKTAA